MSRLLDMTVVATKFFVTGINPQKQKLGVMIYRKGETEAADMIRLDILISKSISKRYFRYVEAHHYC